MGSGPVRYYEFENFKVDARRRILTKDGERVQVTARIFDLLLVFVRNEGRILEHEELLDLVWEGAFVEQSNLKKSVSSLRQTLGEDAHEGIFIRTVPRRGYIFVAEVRASAGDDDGAEDTMADELSSAPIIPEENPAVTARPLTESDDKPSGSRVRWIRAVVVGVFAVVLATAGFLIWRTIRRPALAEDFRLDNIQIKKLTTTGNIVEATVSPDGRTIAYASFDGNGKQALWAKRIGQNNDLQLVPPGDAVFTAVAISPDNNSVYYNIAPIRSNGELYRVSLSGGPPRKIADQASSLVSFSPDGKRIAFVRDTAAGARQLLIANAEDGSDEREIYSVTDNHKLIDPRWSPDGRRIAFINSDVTEQGRVWSISEIPADGGEVRQMLTPQTAKIYTPSWLGDGSGLVFCAELPGTRQTQIWRLNLNDGNVTRLTNDVASYESVVPSADGLNMVATQVEKTGDLWSMDLSLLQNTTRITDSRDFIGLFAVLPDGRILAEYTESGQNGLQFVSADGTKRLPLFDQINGERTPSVTPDGKSLLFVTRRSGSQEVWRSDPDGRNPVQLSTEKSWVTLPRQSHDGRWIYFERYDGSRWRLARMPAGGGQATDLLPERVGPFSLSPDGKYYAFSYLNEQRRRWTVAVRLTADDTVFKEFDIDPNTVLEWLPEGRGLIYNGSETFRDGGNLMIQPLDGGPPRMLLDAKEDRVFFAAFSPDNSKLYLTRGRTISNIVMISKIPK